MVILSLWLILWRMKNFLSSPKLKEHIVGFLPSSGSSSACQETESLPFRYRLARQELKDKLSFSYMLDSDGCGPPNQVDSKHTTWHERLTPEYIHEKL